MSGRLQILAIPGSARRDSTNRRLLGAAREHLPPQARLELWTGLKAVPPFDEDDEGTPPPAVGAMRRALAASHAVLIATPEYNGSVPGQLKNALDWASRPRGEHVLVDKPVAVIGASPTPFGAAWAQAELRKVLGITGAQVVDQELPVPFVFQQFDTDGRLGDEHIRAGIGEILGELVTRAGSRSAQPVA